MRAALIASVLAALATGLGGALVVFLPRLSRGLYNVLLGFSAGVMLAAGTLALLGPALQHNGVVTVATGLASGALLVFLLERYIPHLEPHFAPQFAGPEKRLGLLLLIAMTLHHLPEGLAVGVAFGDADHSLGFIVALAIGLQNIPEGLAVAMPLRAAGFSRTRAILLSTASGLAQPLAAMLGVWFVGVVGQMVPFALALAAGAMIFVASDQLIPESRQHPEAKAPSLGLIAGFLLVAVLTKLFA
jgi:ZIP family zinc transporter